MADAASAVSIEAVEALHAEVLRLVYSDPEEASRLSEAAASMAEALNDDAARALSVRCAANVAYVSGRYAEASDKYEKALRIFERLGRDVEIGRTLNSGLQSLIYLSRYEDAFCWAQRARTIFQSTGDELRLGRLASNIGNILYRQDRHDEALASYREALECLERLGEPRDVAAVLSNMAVCHTSLGQFVAALDRYRQAREFCERNGLPILASAADYNIAWLHYLRGDYLRAMQLYKATREYCARVGDDYHAALSDLDESEMYLDLNLTDEAAELARRAAAGFEKLRMGYERAKAVVNLAIARSHCGDASQALTLFGLAGRLFVREQNRLWPSLIQLYEAVVQFRAGRFPEAHRLSRQAWRSLSRSAMPGKAALCRLLQAQLLLEGNRADAARRRCSQVLAELGDDGPPSLLFHAWFVLGQVEEQAARHTAAYAAYQSARKQIEDLRNRVWTTDLKISILRDKLAVYQRLACMLLDGRVPSSSPREEAFALIQHAKSRSLADQMTGSEPRPTPVVDAAFRQLRVELSLHYRELENAALDGRPEQRERLEAIRLKIRQRERSLALLSAESETADGGRKREEVSSSSSGPASPLTRRSSNIANWAAYFTYVW